MLVAAAGPRTVRRARRVGQLGCLPQGALRGALRLEGAGVRPRRWFLRIHPAVARRTARSLLDAAGPRRRSSRARFTGPAASLDFRESPPHIAGHAPLILSVLLGLFFLQRAFNYWISRYDLTLHTNGVVFGLRYVDHVLWQPGLMAAGRRWRLIAAAFASFNVREPGLRLPVAAAAIVFGPAMILNLLQPMIERLWVKPDELRVEQPYLAAISR